MTKQRFCLGFVYTMLGVGGAAILKVRLDGALTKHKPVASLHIGSKCHLSPAGY